MRHTRRFAQIAFPLAVLLALSACSSSPTVAPASTQAAATGLGAKGCADEPEDGSPDDESAIPLPSSDAGLAEALSATTPPDVATEQDSTSTDDEEPMDDEQDYGAESEDVAPEAEIKGLACSGDTDESLMTEAELGDDQSDASEDALVAAEPVAASPEPPVTRAVSDTPPPPAAVAEAPPAGTSSVLIAGLDAECSTQTGDNGTVVACGAVRQLPKLGTAFTEPSPLASPTASPSATPTLATPTTPTTPTVSTPTASTANPTTDDFKKKDDKKAEGQQATEGQKVDGGRKLYCNALPKARNATRTVALLPRADTPAGLAPGLYVNVIDGLIQLSNRGGVQQFVAGQFGFTGSVVTPPVIVPSNPGIQFTPPPAFSSSSSPQSGSSNSSNNKVDCEVRSAPKRSPRTASVAASDSMARGSIVFIVAGGLRPTSAVSVYLLSAPNSPLGTFDADADGNLSAWVRLPKETTLGADALQVNGYTPKGYTAAITVGIAVRDATTAVATKDITFESGSAQLTGAAQATLDAMLGTIPVGTSSRCTTSSVTRVGTRTPSNIALATARESAAAAYLTALGLECTPGKPRADTTGNPDPERLVTVKISYDQ